LQIRSVCREEFVSGEQPPGIDPLCPACDRLLQWFLVLYADEKGIPKEGWITVQTTFQQLFQELRADSLDYVELVLEAEETFGLTIPDREAERIRTVGDYLCYFQLCGKAKKRDHSSGSRNPLWDRDLDG